MCTTLSPFSQPFLDLTNEFIKKNFCSRDGSNSWAQRPGFPLTNSDLTIATADGQFDHSRDQHYVQGTRHCGISHTLLLICWLAWLAGGSSWALNTSRSCWIFWFSFSHFWAKYLMSFLKFGGRERLTGVPVLPWGLSGLASQAPAFLFFFSQQCVHPPLPTACSGNFRCKYQIQKQQLPQLFYAIKSLR